MTFFGENHVLYGLTACTTDYYIEPIILTIIGLSAAFSGQWAALLGYIKRS